MIVETLNFDSAYDLAKNLPKMREVEIAAILASLEVAGYDGEVIAGFANGMLDMCTKVELGDVFDTCGTGGDKSNTINVSTAVAIALSTITPVAKHGNRAVSSSSGSADVLEKLGIKVEVGPDEAKKLIKKTGFVFLFAPIYHKSFAKVAEVRKRLGIRTIFNILGPLVNPAMPKKQMIGVASGDLIEKVSDAMTRLGKRGVVVYGGIDEVNPSGATTIQIVGEDRIMVYPEDFGLGRVKIIPCKNSEESASRIKAVFAGRGLKEDYNFIAINFATALFALGYDDLKENVRLFKSKIESGEFLKKLEELSCLSTSTSNL